MLRIVIPIDKHLLYLKAFLNTAKLCKTEQDLMLIKNKYIYYGVKIVNTEEKPSELTEEYIKESLAFANIIMSMMSLLTPLELVQIFPIDKVYDGDKTECKDYFYTMDYLKGTGLNKPIGEEINNLLWEYCNSDIRMFNVNMLSLISDLRWLDGEPSIMEQFLSDNKLPTYTLHKDTASGTEYIYDPITCRTQPLNRALPNHLRIVE